MASLPKDVYGCHTVRKYSNIRDRLQVMSFFLFLENAIIRTTSSRLRPANLNNFEKWPERVKNLDHPDLVVTFGLLRKIVENYDLTKLFCPPFPKSFGLVCLWPRYACKNGDKNIHGVKKSFARFYIYNN